ncbi:hypothetical protein WJX73_008975 [Symbiochloris irregularis]|uniref:PCI domain-containing protein n=1 Tax=Symbiochloris irregularis TaxID=706552 RepID=A0AAW1NP46_9CHLO
MGKEVAMEVDAPTQNGNAAKEEPAGPAPVSVEAQLESCLKLLDRAVRAKDTRLIAGRLLRQIATLRSNLTAEVLFAFIEQTLPQSFSARETLLNVLHQAAQVTTLKKHAQLDEDTPTSVLPEVELVAYLLVVTFLIDQKQFPKAKELSTQAVARLGEFNRRTLDGLGSRIYFYYSWAHEQTDTLADIRGKLLALHRTAVLRHDELGQEMLINLLLRNYLHYNLYDQAEKLRAKAQRPENPRSSQQLCRYLFYLARIQAIQLDYTGAKDNLQQAARKAPVIAVGFRTTVAKWLVLVRLLLGEIPERIDLTQPGLSAALHPYFCLTLAVRSGDLSAFRAVAQQHEAVWAKDRVANLVVRLRHNVIRAGLRRINLAYWRISLADIASKLGLSSVEDTECIVAKAIRDGGIDAEIDHEKGWVTSRATPDVYTTAEPQADFHERIAFCLDLHNEAVKAMRFEPNSQQKAPLENADTARERVKLEEEAAKAAAEDDADF